MRIASKIASSVRPVDYDAELRLHNSVLRQAYGIRHHCHVLDIGCGTGQTTRDAARLAASGSAMGVDVSAPMIRRARELATAEGLHNATFEQGDAEIHRFPSMHFDVVISRFGTMFFADAVAAFANIRRALRPGGRLVMMVWQSGDRNEWFVSICRSLAAGEASLAAPAGSADPFAFADPTTVEQILNVTGFVNVTFTEVNQPVYYGQNVATALSWVRGFSCTNDLLQRLDCGARERALGQLCETLSAHKSARGIWFDSCAWIVDAYRR